MKTQKNVNLGNILRIGAIAVPWLCAVSIPILRIDGFYPSPFNVLFFEFVMIPLGNVAMLGMTANVPDRGFGLTAFLFIAGVILPPVVALLFARYWRRWQFMLVWLGYAVLLVWDSIVASIIILMFVKGVWICR